MRVLDLGCGTAHSSIFLAKEFGVSVWAVDLTHAPTDNWKRIGAAGVADRVFPLRSDARSLPVAHEFFDAAVSIGAYQYFGTEDFYLRKLVQYLRPGARLAIALPGVRQELDAPPAYFGAYWVRYAYDALHTPEWWRHFWERSQLVDVEVAALVPDGFEDWLAWRELLASRHRNPSAYKADLDVLRADGGRLLSLVEVVARVR
jgi:cyclopropane fatty-acyl-phospholipid synthase-like methyltransferase